MPTPTTIPNLAERAGIEYDLWCPRPAALDAVIAEHARLLSLYRQAQRDYIAATNGNLLVEAAKADTEIAATAFAVGEPMTGSPNVDRVQAEAAQATRTLAAATVALNRAYAIVAEAMNAHRADWLRDINAAHGEAAAEFAAHLDALPALLDRLDASAALRAKVGAPYSRAARLGARRQQIAVNGVPVRPEDVLLALYGYGQPDRPLPAPEYVATAATEAPAPVVVIRTTAADDDPADASDPDADVLAAVNGF